MTARNRAFVTLFALAVVVPCSAQTPLPTGTPEFGSFGGGPDVIELGGLNAHISIPVIHKNGRGTDFTYDLSYDTSVWYPTGSGSGSWQPALNWGWRGQTEIETGYVSRKFTVLRTCRDRFGNIIGQQYEYSNWVYHDPFGTPHGFGDISIHVTGSCGTGENFSDTSDGYTLTTTNGAAFTLNDKLGKRLNVPVSTTTGSGSAVDRNGNVISADSSGHFTDTLGVVAVTVAGSGNPSSPMTFTYDAPGSQGTGTPVAVTVSYKTYTVKTNFACSGIAEYGPTSNSLVDRVTLPDNTYYQFNYEATPGFSGDYTGRLASITLPTGATISYQYSGGGSGVNGITCLDGSAATLIRTTPDGMWTYAKSLGSGSASTTTITDPQGNVTTIQFQKTFKAFYETQRQLYQGAVSPANLLQTTTTCYNGNTSNCPGTTITLPITQRNVTVTLPGGLQSEHDDFWNTYTAPTESDDYDYGGAPHGPLLKKITASYANLGAIQGMRQTVTIQDGSGSTVSQITNNYDQTAVVATSGTPQHQAVSGARGNLTSVYMYTNATTYLTKTNTYFDTGNIQTATDVNGAQTTYTYGACGNSFVTNIAEPLNLSRSITWDANCYGAVETSSTDEDGQIPSTTYTDPYFWRPASTVDPSGAVTTYCYGVVTNGTCTLNPNQKESTLTFNSGNSAVDALLTLDSLGRTHIEQTRQAPGSSNFDSVETDYDSIGRINRVTLPYVGTAGQTNSSAPAVSRTYDVMNRLLTISDSGGGSLTYAYGQANDVLVTRGPAPQTENTKVRQLEYDGLGRLTSVCEVTSGSTPWPGGTCAQTTQRTGYWTKYGYDPLGDLKSVNQNAQNSGATQSRTYFYDFLSRMTSETVPESGITTFVYDTTGASPCNGGSTFNGDLVRRVDAAGNNTCFYYDALHRLTDQGMSGPNTTSCKRFRYDNTTGVLGSIPSGITVSNVLGRLAEAETDTCAWPITQSSIISDEWFSYTARGEQSDIYESTPNSHAYYHVSESYWANRLPYQLSGSISLPIITYSPDGKGRINSVSASSGQSPLVSSTSYNSANLPTAITLGSATSDTDNYTWDPNTNRMTHYNFAVNGTNLSAVLGWNANSTVQTQNITDGFNSPDSQNCSYLYDDIERVTSATCGTAASQTFSYDPFGNINKVGSPYSFQPSYSTSTNQITQVGSFVPTYDNNGNVLNDNVHNYAWDADGHAVSIDSGLSDSVNITYDALGRMVEQNRSGVYSQIAYSPDGRKLALMSGQNLQKGLVALSGKAIAAFTSTGLQYYGHADLLGSVRLATTPSRTMFFDTAYAPFGETYASAGTLEPAYTGKMDDTSHRQDTAGGLYDFPLREYSIEGRWPSPDPLGDSATSLNDPQTQNRYAYVRNNPLTFVDLLGAQGCSVEDPNCGACDPLTDPFCFFPPPGGMEPGSSGGDQGWPGAIWYPVPLIPPGIFAALEERGSNILETGEADCDCTSTNLRPHKPSGIYGCTYRCDCDKPKAPYTHKNVLTFLSFKQLLVQHVKQYGKPCIYCPTNAKGKFGYTVEQIKIFFGINLDLTLYTPIYLTYVSETP